MIDRQPINFTPQELQDSLRAAGYAERFGVESANQVAAIVLEHLPAEQDEAIVLHPREIVPVREAVLAARYNLGTIETLGHLGITAAHSYLSRIMSPFDFNQFTNRRNNEVYYFLARISALALKLEQIMHS